MDDAIARLWQWWEQRGADGFAQLIGRRGDFSELSQALTGHVTAIDERLAWELGPGEPHSQHSLTISSGGLAELRALATRVVAAAPAPTDVWSFRSSRWRAPQLAGLKLTLNGQQLALEDFRVGFEEDRAALRINVGVDHPAFKQLTKEAQHQAAFLALDWTLGEDDVERWVGTVEVGFGEATLTPTLGDLRRAVDGMAQWWQAEHAGEPQWRILRAKSPAGKPVLATAMFPLRWIDHLPMDWHLGVTLEYRPNGEGFPEGDELTRVRDLEDSLVEVLGSAALLVAHESCDGWRVLHFYYDGADPSVGPRAVAWADAHRGVSVALQRDPQWHEVRGLG